MSAAPAVNGATRTVGTDSTRTHGEILANVKREIAANESKPLVIPSGMFSPERVLAKWRTEGPLIHEPTGLAHVDALTDGGPVYGSRWYLMGAPNTGKTALEIQIADAYLSRGVTVGLLAVDEEADDLIGRMLQRRGFTRADCEARDPLFLSRAEDALRGLPLRLYDGTWTIERAAADLAAYAKERASAQPAMHPHGPRAFLGVDSVQVVSCDRELEATSVREAVTARVVALRAVAQRHRLISFATSEMNRGAYRSLDSADTVNDLASAKESGAIEYSARVLLSMRSLDDDLIEVRVAKNKHGPSGPKVRVHLRIDRRLQELAETDAPAESDDEPRQVATVQRERARNIVAAAALVAILIKRPGLATREVAPELRAVLGQCSAVLATTAIAVLGAAIHKHPGPRNALYLYLVGVELADDILGAMPTELRARARQATPPAEVLS